MEENLMEELDLNSGDESQAPIAHKKLLGAVSKLYEKKRVKAPTRKEPSLEVSEFHLSQPGKKHSNRVKLTELAKVLNKRAIHAEIGQKLKTAQKRAKTLPKPLEKIHTDKINRKAGYEHAKQQLNRWDAIVYKQKVAEQLHFPLRSEPVSVNATTDVSKLFRKPTELELKMAELMKDPDPLAQLAEENKLTRNVEEDEDYPLTLAEVIEKRKMMAKLRAQQSYKQAKSARHSKIKSKKFHQIQRRTRVKEQLRDFEELQKKDPEAALKKLEELERTRAEERITLRHRSTGQWAKNLAVRAKYDKEARIALSEQLAKSKELTVKLANNKESESEKEEEEEVQPEQTDEDPNNPWVVKRSKEMVDFVSGYRKYWENKGKEIEKEQTTDTSVKVKTVHVEGEKTPEKPNDISGKENKPLESVINTKVIKDNSALSNSETKCNNKSKNVSVIGDTPLEHTFCENKNSKTPSPTISRVPSSEKKVRSINHKSVSRHIQQSKNISEQNITFTSGSSSPFTISRVRSSKKKVQSINGKSGCREILQSKNISEQNITSTSGSWTVAAVKDRNTTVKNKLCEVLEKGKGKKVKKVQSLGNAYEVAGNKLTKEVPKPKKRTLTVKERLKGKAQEKVQKVKSLDELFDEVEDKLQEKITNKFEKIKGKLNRKRENELDSDIESETEEGPSLELKRTKVLVDVDEELFERTKNNGNENSTNNNLTRDLATASSTEVKKSDDIDPNKFIKVTPRHLSSKIPDIMTQGEDALDDEERTEKERHLTISEAFAEDDVVDQFQKEKEEEVKKNSIGDLDLSLPGWGNWAGHNMKIMPRRKRKKFVIKFPKVIPRRDTNRGNVIINEDADQPIKEHQVSDVPFPFTSVKEYEASIRAPLGSTWVPETAHRKLTLPPVVTKLGTVIQPMDDSQLMEIKKEMPNIAKKRKFNKK